ncbi:MAG: hypothetical protein IJJ28_07315 [Lentisphaeria bacterium]|nr:hypothetical protein [Lentisphaeria bacterium]
MAEKMKKRTSRRAQERLQRARRSFDLAMLALALTSLFCAAISYLRGADLAANASSGFAYWFLVVVGYLPMLPVNAVRALLNLPVPAPGKHTELLLLTVTVLVFLAVVWQAVRIVGKRSGKVTVIHIATRIVQIVLCWGLFQIGCVAVTAGWNRGGRAVVSRDAAPKTAKAALPSVK